MLFGNYGVNQKVINALLIILVIWSLAEMSAGEWIYLLLTLPAVIIAITFHEFAHAKAADKLGDTTPRSQGRLTLNPLAHLDWFGFFLMMFAHIGWGKPVQINPNNFNSNKSRSYCEAMVALAGPLMNFLIAIIACIVYALITVFASNSFVNGTIGYFILLFLDLLITVNIGLGVFNLIPLPPLDGEKIFSHIMPYKVQEWLDRNYQTLYVIFLILWIFGILSIIVSPVINVISNGLFAVVYKIISLFA
jgi:Zn-dependent protease